MPSLYRLPKGGSNQAAGIWLGLPGIYLLVLIGGLWISTQYVAHRLNYHPNLGEPLFWHLYSPWKIIVWRIHYHSVDAYRPLWMTCVHILGLSHLAFIPAWGLAVWRGKRLGGHTDLHGSARWAEHRDVKRAGFLTEAAGVILGRWKGNILCDNSQSHVFVVAPSGKGKGINTVIPTCLTWTKSMIVNDVKGEIFQLTAGYRAQELKQPILRFDPTCADGSASRYNPLLAVRPHPYDVRDVQLIVEQIVDPHGKGLEKHWDRTASDLLTGVILHQLYEEEDKSLAGCLKLMTDPRRKITNTLKVMLQSQHETVAGAARAILDKPEEERGSVISTALGFLSLYRDPLIAINTSTSDFDIRDILDPALPVSLYLTTPVADILRVRPLVRILLHQTIQRFTEKLAESHEAPGIAPHLLLMVDEFPTLGKLEFFSQGLAWMRGYGVKTCLITQDFGQVETIYGKEKTLLANCDTVVAFAPNLTATAKELSDMIGARTVTKEQRTYSGGRMNIWLSHVIATEVETRRKLLEEDEWRRLPDHLEVIIPNGKPPILTEKLRYYADKELLRRSRIAAPLHSAVLSQDVYGWMDREPQTIEEEEETIVVEASTPAPAPSSQQLPEPPPVVPDNLF